MKNENFNSYSFGYNKLKFVADNLLDILFTKAEEISIPEILKKICVSPPYFAFKKIYRYENILISQIEPEQPIEDEAGKIAITEAGRHLAILGSCSFAINEQEKFYYLANKALMKAFPTSNSDSRSNKILLVIKAVYDLKKKLQLMA